MKASKKQLVLILLLPIVLIVIVFCSLMGRAKPGPEEGQVMLCMASPCKAVFTLSLDEIRQQSQEVDPLMIESSGSLAFVCPMCSQKTAYTAEKCSFCETVFISDPSARDYCDRCPKCGKSELEEKRKNARF